MPKSLADGKIRFRILTTMPANIDAIEVGEVNAGIIAECKVLKSDFRLSATGSDTIADTELCSEGNSQAWGASNYEGSMTPFRYLDEDGDPVVLEDAVWEAVKEKGTEFCAVISEGKPHSTPFVVGDEYDAYIVLTDNPQKPTDRGGYIKRVAPPGVPRAAENKVIVADVP
mgnify:FL=1